MKNKKLTGYASIDNPQNIGATFFTPLLNILIDKLYIKIV